MSAPSVPASATTGKASTPFSRRSVIFMVIIGFAAFFGLLYSLGVGDALRDTNNGQAHGASNSLVGYKALANLTRKTGRKVTLNRSGGKIREENLMIVTPGYSADEDDLTALIEQRRYMGPTLVILPKWQVGRKDGLKPGWVTLLFPGVAEYNNVTGSLGDVTVSTGSKNSQDMLIKSPFSGSLKAPEFATTIEGDKLIPLVTNDNTGDALISVYDNGGYFPEFFGENTPEPADEDAYNYYPVLVTAEPDFFNNLGMAEKETAAHAIKIIDSMMYDDGMPIVFDLTMVGLGSSENLLTLAFRPPFLSATICLIIAAFAAAWMAFYRFGPPAREARAIDYGKEALVANSAAFVRRLDRDYLLAEPYADIIRAQSAEAIGLPSSLGAEETEKQLDKLGTYDGKTFTQLAWELRSASKRGDIAATAAALYRWKKEMIR